MELSGRTVLLTGASGGIGQAIARRLRRDGATPILSGRRAEVLEPLAAETGGRALAVDLADREAVARLAADCAGADVLVANAGLPASGDALGFSVEEIDRALEVNLRAPMVLARLLGEEMAARGSGHLVFVSSLSGKVGTAGSAVYSATKFGLRGFGQGLRADLARRGVGVSVVFPGFVRDAGMFHESGTRLPWFVGTSTPDEVAEAVATAIARDRGEVAVAPRGMRVASTLGGAVPRLSEVVTARFGGPAIARQMAQGQRAKR
jgi:short-subunit dehydrogenase